MACPSSRFLAVPLLLALSSFGASAYPALGGYMPVSNVLEHTEIIKDVMAFADALAGESPDYAKAKKIYMFGAGNSCKSPSSVRTLQGFAQKDLTGESFADKFIAGGFPAKFWDAVILAALDGTADFVGAERTKRVTSLRKLVVGLCNFYASHELEAAIKKVESGDSADGSGSTLAWDEGWAFYYGSETDGAEAAWGEAAEYDADFAGNGSISVSTEIMAQFNAGLHFVRNSTANLTNAIRARDTIYKLWALTYIRAALKYVELSETSYNGKVHAEGFAWYMAIDGFVASYHASAAQAMRDALNISKTSVPSGTFCAVKEQMLQALPAMGLDCKALGTFKDSTLTASCPSVCNVSATLQLPAGRSPAAAVNASASSNIDCSAAAGTAAAGTAAAAAAAAAGAASKQTTAVSAAVSFSGASMPLMAVSLAAWATV
ncbi:unnamed protein product [Polarella glacialis]|uniref:Uncharacterized protein n=1 Tax=Polarella glacialis TaxID=89957 RepID=A0A813E6F8_POLGL|nr:unnamed protein product [Polarella glacialis]